MMRTLLIALSALSLLVAPAQVGAQVEVGLDAGLSNNFGFSIDGNDLDQRLTEISIPSPTLRLGVHVGERGIVETLLSFRRLSDGDSDLTVITLLPGYNFAFGESGGYARVEGGLSRVDEATQFALGAAVGVKRAIGDGPVSWRLEAGFDRWLENSDEFEPSYNSIRVLFGVSARVN